MTTDEILVRGARLHNLKNIDVTIPKNQLVVLSGVSGSGKSSLGFDILNREGARQYIESLGMVPYGMSKPPVEEIRGLSPSISIDQRLSNRSPRSTVGTSTDLYSYLRVLYARLGRRPCPHCGKDLPPENDPGIRIVEISNSDLDEETEAAFPCPACGKPVTPLTMANFSFNKPAGACPTCSGLGTVAAAMTDKLVDQARSVAEGAVQGWNSLQIDYYIKTLSAAAKYYGLDFDPAQPLRDYSPAMKDLLLHGVDSPIFQKHVSGKPAPKTVRQGHFEGVATSVLRRHGEHIQAHVQEANYADALEEVLVRQTCPDCGGTRLKAESRTVAVTGKSIVETVQIPLEKLSDWLDAVEATLNGDEKLIAAPVLTALREGLRRLEEVGAGYLTMDRPTGSLSAGEAQRLRLASLLGSGLSGVLYVFDEPTIGLHARDTHRLIEVLKKLRDLGNTVLVIEHDLEVIRSADWVIDFGPGAGRHGGEVTAAGTPETVAATLGSQTGDYLSGRVSIPIPEKRRQPDHGWLTIRGARENNLKELTVRFPLGLLTMVTGVSGSGKSSLVFDILDRALRQKLYRSGEPAGKFNDMEGWETIDKVITINQEHISRMPRSNAVTYTEVHTPIREAFAATEEAERRGFSAATFSFNNAGGRCERCQGAGVLTIQMQLLPDVEVRCPVCHGRRFKAETLEVHYRGHDIAEVLELTVDEALDLFQEAPAVRGRLEVLAEAGLGYLQLGQPATTLSGGEAQRVKLAKELGRRSRGRTLYLLDEPTTGLHLADSAKLLALLQRLVEAGSSVIVVEHNLEMAKAADWMIDLGPEGGEAGGWLVAEGTPEAVMEMNGSFTGQYLKQVLKRR